MSILHFTTLQLLFQLTIQLNDYADIYWTKICDAELTLMK